MIKYSSQREAIVQQHTGRTDHPSAETVYQALRQTHPNISLGTVYRNLGVLEENGQLMRIPMDNGSDRFDPNVVPHYHFLCRKCGCLQDVPMTALDSLNQLAQAHIDGIVESHALLFKGVCKRCSEDTKQFFYYIFEKTLDSFVGLCYYHISNNYYYQSGHRPLSRFLIDMVTNNNKRFFR